MAAAEPLYSRIHQSWKSTPLETTLHQQLKDLYSPRGSQQEVRLGRYRIDVVHRGRLIEIQHSGLGAIRDKVRILLDDHDVDVVKPLVEKKMLVRLDARQGQTVSQRWSPARGDRLGVFQELLHFANVFPHPRLRLITPLIQIEELRYPGHGRRRRWRKNDFVVQDQRITRIGESFEYRLATDLGELLPPELPEEFDTAQLSGALGVQPWQARQIAWVLKKTGATTEVGKRGNRFVYRLVKPDVGKPDRKKSRHRKRIAT